jgi:hypothetical protein
VELRLLADSAFQEEFDTVVDEIAALYVTDQFQGEDKRSVEEHFLKSPDRQNKVKFMGELLGQVALAKGEEVTGQANNTRPAAIVAAQPGLFERIRSWWTNQPPSLRAVTTLATVVIVAGLAFWLRPGAGPTYESLELAMVSSDRGAGSEIPRVTLKSGIDGLRIKLKLPDDALPAKSYRVQLRGEKVSRQLPVEQQDSQSLTVIAPAKDLSRGTYAIALTAITATGPEVPLRGAFQFAID